MRNLFSHARLAVCALSICSAAHSQAILYGRIDTSHRIDVTAGLDEPTRKLIQSLPKEVQENVVKAIQESLSQAEVTATKLIDTVDKTTKALMLQAACTARGLAPTVPEDLVRGLLGMPRKEALLDLYQKYENRGRAFRATTAKDIAVNYAAFLDRATNLMCVTADSEARLRIDSLSTEARERAVTWREIETTCRDSAECTAARYKAIGQLLASSPNSDLDFTDARAKYQAIKLPSGAQPTAGTLLEKFKALVGLSPAPSWVEAEPVLTKLREIDRSLHFAKWTRETNARQRVNSVSTSVSTAEKELSDAEGKLRGCTQTTCNEAGTTAARVLASLSGHTETLKLATIGDAKLEQEVVSLYSRLKSLDVRASTLRENAKKAIDTLKASQGRIGGTSLGCPDAKQPNVPKACP
jgi:hypothetical protein